MISDAPIPDRPLSQDPSRATSMFFLCLQASDRSMQTLLYVFPSEPQTGAKMAGQTGPQHLPSLATVISTSRWQLAWFLVVSYLTR